MSKPRMPTHTTKALASVWSRVCKRGTLHNKVYKTCRIVDYLLIWSASEFYIQTLVAMM